MASEFRHLAAWGSALRSRRGVGGSRDSASPGSPKASGLFEKEVHLLQKEKPGSEAAPHQQKGDGRLKQRGKAVALEQSGCPTSSWTDGL